jgi:hypothetical protein
LDRFSTWDEVRNAISASSQSAWVFLGARNDLYEADSDFSGIAWKLSEDTIWWAIVSEKPDSKSN